MDFAKRVKDFALDCWDSYSPFRLVVGLLSFIFYFIVFVFCWGFNIE